MKRTGRVLAILLALAMLLSVTAFATGTAASWSVFGGNADHNAVVDNAPTTGVTVTKINLLNSNSGWDGVDNVPLMQTVGTDNDAVTYAYVLYDGHAAGCTLAKINCSADTPYVVWHKQIESASGFQLSTPLLVKGSNDNSEADDVIYAASNSGVVYKIEGLQANDTNATGVTATEIYTVSKGQINTPIVSYGDYIYFGTWVGNGTIEGSTEPGRYYQVQVANVPSTSDDSYPVQSVSSIYKGFYWGGAVAVGEKVYFCGDGGYLYYRPMGDGFGTTADTDIYATSISLPSVDGNAAGDVRSTIMTKDGKLYFASKGSSIGNVYCYTIGSNGVPAFSWGAKLSYTIGNKTYSGNCTSTPVIADSGNIYVGFYSGFSAGGLMKITAPTSGTVGTATLITVGGVAFTQPVQCTPVVYSKYGLDYFYFNTNSNEGAGYCFSVPVNSTNATQVWATDGDTYALGGMAICDGYAVFGNDYNHFYVIG